jgi:Fibronectin type III domain
MTKQIHVNVGFGSLSDKDVATQGVAVVDGLTNNPKLPNPLINPADLKAQIDKYVGLIAASADGSKQTIAERRNQRAVVVKMLRQLGHWVEANCNDDPAILQSSGFQQRVTAARSNPAQSLDGPPSFKVDSGKNSGQVVLRGKPVSKAVSYKARYAPIGSDGKPGTWTEVPVTGTRSVTVTGLTPGANYAFQMCALGRAGYTDWSDSVTRISL